MSNLSVNSHNWGNPYRIVLLITGVLPALIGLSQDPSSAADSSSAGHMNGAVEAPLHTEKDVDSKRAMDDSLKIELLGFGNIQRSVDQGDGLPAGTGVGVRLNQVYEKPLLGKVGRLQLAGQITIANTADTLRIDTSGLLTSSSPSQLGLAVMTPLVGRRAVDIEAIFHVAESGANSLISGLMVRYTGSSRVVRFGENSVEATMNAFRARFFHNFVPVRAKLDIDVLFGLGYAYNSLQGDLGLRRNEPLRMLTLGTTEKQYGGPEAYFGIRMQNIRAEFSYTWLRAADEVPGLTGSRLITTISFAGGVPVAKK